MKTVLFVPGYQEDLQSRDYDATISAIMKKDYKVEFVSINWLRTTIEDWVSELDKVYETYDPKNTILAGFSYGAMTAFISATKKNPFELWLFSLSPYFAEDLKSKNMKQTWLNGIGHRRRTAFGKLNFAQLSKKVKCKTLLFAGQLEIDKWPVIGERVNKANKLMPRATLMIVQKAGHDVTNEDYIEEIAKLI
ncbi:MAG: alpha/beta hydrolase [Candidatus Microsaccharimonas sp.]